MSIVEYIAIGLSALIALRAIQNLINLFRSLALLKKSVLKTTKPTTNFVVCIPVLNEQATIIETINTFIYQKYPGQLLSIYIASTAKEDRIKGTPTTEEVVRAYKSSLPKKDSERIHIIRFPKTNGHMSHQINYVAKKLKNELQQKNTYFVVYNADSHIHEDTFNLVNQTILDTKRKTNKAPTILQQSAVYQYAGDNKLAEGAGLHQTLWTLTHEIPRLLTQSSRVTRLKNTSMVSLLINSRVAHCVGHGLFVRGEYYIKHPLPQNILNEDLPYGLKACALHESICSIPSLELASTPNRIANVYRQKSVWFNPFFEFLSYGSSLIKNNWYISKREVTWLLIQAYASLLIWLVHSFVLIGGLVMSLVAGPAYVIFWAISFALYWLIPAVIVTHTRQSIPNAGSNSYGSILAGIPYVMTHSTGPIIAVGRWFKASIRGTAPTKPKTETT